MKKVSIIILLSSLITLGCNDQKKSPKESEDEKMSTMKNDSVKETEGDTSITEVSHRFTSVDADIRASMTAIIAGYLDIKNSLANDNSNQASKAAKSMNHRLTEIDRSKFTSEEKELFSKEEENLKEHSEHIAKSSDISHQRSHFIGLSKALYEIVKGFGGGIVLYHDYCPMARDNEGALWLSETAAIKNPYLGSNMPGCGDVKEKIK